MHGLKVTPLLALVFLVVGCGLPSPYFLSPPSVLAPFGQLTNSCTIVNSGRSGDYQATFEGFELYYKFFGYTTDSTFLADQQYATTSYTPPDLINSHGFRRVTLGRGSPGVTPDSTPGFGSAPLINVAALDPTDLANSFSIVISFNDSTSAASTGLAGIIPYSKPLSFFTFGPSTGANGVGTEIYEEIRRFVSIDATYGISECKFFTNNQSVTPYQTNYHSDGSDPDVSTGVYTTSQSQGGKIVVMVYAAAYGHAGSQVVYSTPVYLGYTQIPAFN